MENEFITRRRLIIVLITVTVIVFVGLVWLIARLQPWERLGYQGSTSTLNVPQVNNCTYPITYWKAHPELFPTQVIIGGIVYKERELEALLSDNNPDIGQQIKAQLAVVFLNSQRGADQNSIETTVFEAYGWLVKHPNGSTLTNEELEDGRRLFNLLEAYNTGTGGVAPCEAIFAFTKTVTFTATSTVLASLPSSQTSTATETSTSTTMITLSTTVFIPSDTPIPTTSRPGVPSWTPTRTSPGGPTITPTTRAPSPTRTPAPSPTRTPQPTFTATLRFTSTSTPPPTNTSTPQPTSTATLPPTFTPSPTLLPTLPPTDTLEPTLPAR